MDFGVMGLSLVWVVVLLLALVMGVVWLVRLMFPQAGDPQDAQKSLTEDGALETARQRYARGEITAEEFARLERDLT